MSEVIRLQKLIICKLGIPDDILPELYKLLGSQTINGKKEGPWVQKERRIGEQDFILSHGIFINDLREGQWKGYYLDTGKNESLARTNASLANFVNGKRHGLCKEYFSNGNVRIKYMMKNGVQHGKYIRYLPDGRYFSKGQYINGRNSDYSNLYDMLYVYEDDEEYDEEQIRKIVISEIVKGRGGWEELIDA